MSETEGEGPRGPTDLRRERRGALGSLALHGRNLSARGGEAMAASRENERTPASARFESDPEVEVVRRR